SPPEAGRLAFPPPPRRPDSGKAEPRPHAAHYRARSSRPDRRALPSLEHWRETAARLSLSRPTRRPPPTRVPPDTTPPAASVAAAGDRTDGAGRNEEVRVDHVRSEVARSCERRSCQPEVLHLGAAPPIENRALDLMAACDELLLEPAHEHAEVGVGRPGVHLG